MELIAAGNIKISFVLLEEFISIYWKAIIFTKQHLLQEAPPLQNMNKLINLNELELTLQLNPSFLRSVFSLIVPYPFVS